MSKRLNTRTNVQTHEGGKRDFRGKTTKTRNCGTGQGDVGSQNREENNSDEGDANRMTIELAGRSGSGKNPQKPQGKHEHWRYRQGAITISPYGLPLPPIPFGLMIGPVSHARISGWSLVVRSHFPRAPRSAGSRQSSARNR